MSIAEALDLLASGESIGMPLSRPMPDVEVGAHELRVKDASGNIESFIIQK